MMTLLTVVLTILCTFEVAELVLTVLLLNKISGKDSVVFPSLFQKSTEVSAPSYHNVDPVELEKARQQFADEMKAFQDLMNYNTDVAYGINKGNLSE